MDWIRKHRMRLLIGLAVAGVSVHAAGTYVPLPLGLQDILYHGILFGSAFAVGARALRRRRGRLPWTLVAIGLLLWAGADLYFETFLASDPNAAYPSIADAAWIAFYPLMYVAALLLMRETVTRVPLSLWLDGLVGALALTAAALTFVYDPIFDGATVGTPAQVATNLSYPIGDLVLLSMTIVIFGAHAWRPGRRWLLVGLGLVVSAVADTAYLYGLALGTFNVDGLLATLWPVSCLFFAFAAWQPRPAHGGTTYEGRRGAALPAAFTLLAVTMLVRDHFDRIGDIAIWLSGAALAAAALRAALTFHEYADLLRKTRVEATTDSLTGLPNRRALKQHLEIMIPERHPFGLAMLDLDGFKSYNDAYGHMAGDDLLARLAGRLRDALPPDARAYRLGGDEFCVLVPGAASRYDESMVTVQAALSERGDGFMITSSMGFVLVPEESRDTRTLLTLADRRMYAEKARKAHSSARQTSDALLSALAEREPGLNRHLREVAATAQLVGREMNLDAERLDEVVRAAELHDVGKLAIPDTILTKPEPLTESEWTFMRAHTLIGERILSCAPALMPVALIVRSSHERWDGAGYPDGLAGEKIPLGARIVFACDALNAMTSTRPYSDAKTLDEALEELERCAGTQFDPDVVAALVRVARAPAAGALHVTGRELERSPAGLR